MTTRRSLIAQLPAAAVAGRFALRAQTVFAADKSVTVGITVPLTGSDTEQATLMKEGATIAVDDANAKGGVAGYKINVIVLDNGTATPGNTIRRRPRPTPASLSPTRASLPMSGHKTAGPARQ